MFSFNFILAYLITGVPIFLPWPSPIPSHAPLPRSIPTPLPMSMGHSGTSISLRRYQEFASEDLNVLLLLTCRWKFLNCSSRSDGYNIKSKCSILSFRRA